MQHLANQLTTTREQRRATTVQDEWNAVKAVLDDFQTKATHPAPPAGGDLPPSCGLTVTEGPEPKFSFDPYDAVTRMSPNTPAGAWEAESDWVLERIRKLSKLDVEWDRSAKLIYLTIPKPDPAAMLASLHIDVHADVHPAPRQVAGCPHGGQCMPQPYQGARGRQPRRNNIGGPEDFKSLGLEAIVAQLGNGQMGGGAPPPVFGFAPPPASGNARSAPAAQQPKGSPKRTRTAPDGSGDDFVKVGGDKTKGGEGDAKTDAQ